MISFRTDDKFQNHLKKGVLLNATDYILPTEICAMVNVVIDAKNQSLKLCAVDGVDVVSSNLFKHWNTTYDNIKEDSFVIPYNFYANNKM